MISASKPFSDEVETAGAVGPGVEAGVEVGVGSGVAAEAEVGVESGSGAGIWACGGMSWAEIDFFSGGVTVGAGSDAPKSVPDGRRIIGRLGMDWDLVVASFTLLSYKKGGEG